MSAVDAGAVLTTVAAGRARIRWRKLLLRRRQEQSFAKQSFKKLWKQYFPQHDPVTLRLKRPAQSKAESYWEGESWKAAARWYHEQRRSRTLLVEDDPKQVT